MIRWVCVFIVLALFTAIVGFSELATATAGIARALCVVFVAMSVLTFATDRTKR